MLSVRPLRWASTLTGTALKYLVVISEPLSESPSVLKKALVLPYLLPPMLNEGAVRVSTIFSSMRPLTSIGSSRTISLPSSSVSSASLEKVRDREAGPAQAPGLHPAPSRSERLESSLRTEWLEAAPAALLLSPEGELVGTLAPEGAPFILISTPSALAVSR